MVTVRECDNFVAVKYAEVDEIVTLGIKDPPNNCAGLGPIDAEHVVDLIKEDMSSRSKQIICIILLAVDKDVIVLGRSTPIP